MDLFVFTHVGCMVGLSIGNVLGGTCQHRARGSAVPQVTPFTRETTIAVDSSVQ